MAIVPTYDRFKVTPGELPQATVNTPNLHTELAGKAATAMGEGLSHIGGDVGKMAEQMAAETNQLRLDDASMQLREKARQLQYGQQTANGQADPGQPVGYTQLQGRQALDRPDGQSLAEEYGSMLQKHIDNISESLGNDAQRAAFSHYSKGFLGGFQDNAWQHAYTQQRTYATSVADGLKGEAIEDLKNNANSPVVDQALIDKSKASIEIIKAQANRLGQLKGLSDPEIALSTKKDVSQAVQTGVNIFLANNNPQGANDYFKAFSEHMTMDDALPATLAIKKASDNQIGMAGGSYAFNKALATVQPAPGELAFKAMPDVANFYKKGVVQTESGNQSGVITHINKDGSVDYGPGQVNEKTGPEAAKLAGLKWDFEQLKTNPDYGHALGMALFQDKYKQYGGDLELASAAYHAPARTQQAIKEAKASGGNWLDHVDDELKSYVSTTVNNFNKVQAKAPRELTLADVNPHLDALKLSPEALEKARSNAKYLIDSQNAAIKQQRETAVNDALDAARQSKVPFEQLPFPIQNAVPSDKIGEVKANIKKIFDTGDVNTDWVKYAELRQIAVSDPNKFKSIDLSKTLPYLADPQRKELVDIKTKLIDPAQATHVVELGSQLAIAHNKLGFITSIFARDKGLFDSAVTQAIASESLQKGGRELDYTERQKIIDRMMLPATRPSNIWFGDTTKKMYEVYGTADKPDYKPQIDDNAKALIISALKQEGIEPTEENITTRFKQVHGL